MARLTEGGMDRSIEDDAQALQEVAERFGERMVLAVSSFVECIALQGGVISKLKDVGGDGADWEGKVREVFAPLAEKIEVVAEMADGVIRRDVLEHHLLALGEAVAIFGWMLSQEPVAVTSAVMQKVGARLEEVRNKGRAIGSDQAHDQFADALIGVVAKISAHVREAYPKGFLLAGGESLSAKMESVELS